MLAAAEKLSAVKSILQQHGHYEWLTSTGNFVILNNGIEFALTYLFMLFAIFVLGNGRYTRADHFISRHFVNNT